MSDPTLSVLIPLIRYLLLLLAFLSFASAIAHHLISCWRIHWTQDHGAVPGMTHPGTCSIDTTAPEDESSGFNGDANAASLDGLELFSAIASPILQSPLPLYPNLNSNSTFWSSAFQKIRTASNPPVQPPRQPREENARPTQQECLDTSQYNRLLDMGERGQVAQILRNKRRSHQFCLVEDDKKNRGDGGSYRSVRNARLASCPTKRQLFQKAAVTELESKEDKNTQEQSKNQERSDSEERGGNKGKESCQNGIRRNTAQKTNAPSEESPDHRDKGTNGKKIEISKSAKGLFRSPFRRIQNSPTYQGINGSDHCTRCRFLSGSCRRRFVDFPIASTPVYAPKKNKRTLRKYFWNSNYQSKLCSWDQQQQQPNNNNEQIDGMDIDVGEIPSPSIIEPSMDEFLPQNFGFGPNNPVDAWIPPSFNNPSAGFHIPATLPIEMDIDEHEISPRLIPQPFQGYVYQPEYQAVQPSHHHPNLQLLHHPIASHPWIPQGFPSSPTWEPISTSLRRSNAELDIFACDPFFGSGTEVDQNKRRMKQRNPCRRKNVRWADEILLDGSQGNSSSRSQDQRQPRVTREYRGKSRVTWEDQIQQSDRRENPRQQSDPQENRSQQRVRPAEPSGRQNDTSEYRRQQNSAREYRGPENDGWVDRRQQQRVTSEPRRGQNDTSEYQRQPKSKQEYRGQQKDVREYQEPQRATPERRGQRNEILEYLEQQRVALERRGQQKDTREYREQQRVAPEYREQRSDASKYREQPKTPGQYREQQRNTPERRVQGNKILEYRGQQRVSPTRRGQQKDSREHREQQKDASKYREQQKTTRQYRQPETQPLSLTLSLAGSPGREGSRRDKRTRD